MPFLNFASDSVARSLPQPSVPCQQKSEKKIELSETRFLVIHYEGGLQYEILNIEAGESIKKKIRRS
jgi:hypothetical protein